VSKHLLGSFVAAFMHDLGFPNLTVVTMLALKSRHMRIHTPTCRAQRKRGKSCISPERSVCGSCVALCLVFFAMYVRDVAFVIAGVNTLRHVAVVDFHDICGRLQGASGHSAGRRTLAHECATKADRDTPRLPTDHPATPSRIPQILPADHPATSRRISQTTDRLGWRCIIGVHITTTCLHSCSRMARQPKWN
jgi:hypothetical protein